MTDRIPGAPGQYKATVTAAELEKMQSGESFTITMTRDDQPIVEGTPYNKESVLPDDVANVVCPGVEDPAPADAFLALQTAINKMFITSITSGSADDIAIPLTLRDIRTSNDELKTMFASGGGVKNENYAYIITLFLGSTNADAARAQIAVGYTHGTVATRAYYATTGWKPWNMMMSSILHPYFYGDTLPDPGTPGRTFFLTQ